MSKIILRRLRSVAGMLTLVSCTEPRHVKRAADKLVRRYNGSACRETTSCGRGSEAAGSAVGASINRYRQGGLARSDPPKDCEYVALRTFLA